MTIDEICADMERRGFGEAFIARIRRLNPHPERYEGQMLRGWNRKPTVRSSALYWRVLTRRDFERRTGTSAGDLPPQAFVSGGGRRRWIAAHRVGL